jgi:undecaprenyl diphosphate synthase
MTIKDKINRNKLPRHIAVIMDGNGRWAQGKGFKRVFGHKKGVEAVRQTVEAATELGIEALTLFAFSTENWKRPKFEVDTLMSLLVSSLKKELPTFQKNKIKVQTIGNIEKLPSGAKKQLQEVIELTKTNSKLTLTLALNYGSREEIINATKNISKKIVNNELKIEEIDENIINGHLYTFTLPDVDFLIRTSGELRISNFLPWQVAYAELWVTPTLWPDFTREELLQAIGDYQKRDRRFGGVSD